MQSSIAIHVTIVGNDRAKAEREMLALANKIGIPVTGMLDGNIICRMPDSHGCDMPEFFKDIFK
jgi:thiamine pyrophosphate-dependent acetolactate synthase large subunit-like protein